ncbi:MAG: hypothetical protein KKA84_07190 [Bacteroidetes bacterium]|nr:hypothetical protein [Bacteroidota bacterium]
MYIKNNANISFSNSRIIFYGRKRDLHIYNATFSELSQSNGEHYGDGVTSYFLYINHEQVSTNSFFCADTELYNENITISRVGSIVL